MKPDAVFLRLPLNRFTVEIVYETPEALFMAIQTTTHVSLLQKLLGYFELAATIGTQLPEKHVQLISEVIDLVVNDISKIAGGAQPLERPAIKTAVTLQPGMSIVTNDSVTDPTLPNTATLHIAPVVGVEKEMPAEEPAGQKSQTTVALGVTTPFAIAVQPPSALP